MSEDGNEVCVMCGRRLDDEEDATGISGGVAKENDGFYMSDTPWEVVGSCCSGKLHGFIEAHVSLTEFLNEAVNKSLLEEKVRHLAYELNIILNS